MRYPSTTPDGKHVAFSYRGDIWVAATDGKSGARRLTIHEAQDTVPRISPDGKQIAFSSRRNGGYDVFVFPLFGGEPEQITHHSGVEIVCDWSPDSKHLLVASNRDATNRHLDLYEVPVAGGTMRRVTQTGGRDGSYSADGKHIVYAFGTNTIYQDNYRGSANYDLYVVSREGGMPRQLTKTDGNERYPVMTKDGKSLWFVAESKGVANFYSLPMTGVEPKDAESKRTQVSKYSGYDVHRPALAPDRKTMVFERGGSIYTADLTAKNAKPTAIPLVVKGDRRHSGVATRTIDKGAQHLHLSRDGSKLAISVHGDIWIMDAGGGKARRVTKGPHKDEWPRFRPDGQALAFQSDRTGNSDIFLLDLKSSAIRPITRHKRDDYFHNWSPDGQHLVFSSERSGNRDVWRIDVESGETKQMTKHREGDDDPAYSPDGRLIAFDSGRDGGAANHHIFVMNADGSGGARRVTTGAGFFQVPTFSPDSNLICYESINPATGRPAGLYVVSTSGGQRMMLSGGGAGAAWSSRGDFIYFSVGAEGAEEIYRMPAPSAVEGREKVPFQGTIEVDLRSELADLFDEAWKALKDGFYDPKMHGVDWNAMKKKYRDMAINAEDKAEFQNVVSQMLAELNASHLGVWGGRKRSNTVDARSVPTGNLGIEFEEKLGPSGGRKIKSIMRNGPAAKARLRVGDELVGVRGKKLKAGTDLDKLLEGTVKKEILLAYRPITGEGVGEETKSSITPMSSGAIRQLTYRNWISANAAAVKKQSKGRLAYVHLDQMNQPNLQRFQRAVALLNRGGAAKRIKGMVLDVRGNGGGNIHQQLLQILVNRPYAQMKPRRSPRKITQPALYWDRPIVVLIDEMSFSDAEVFPYCFKALGLGKVVGVATPGGVIGTNDITLSDGTSFRIPRVGYYGMDGTNLEGNGVQPDVVVEMSLEDRIKGRDPQLKKAVEVILGDVAAAKKGATSTPKKTPKTTPKTTPKPETTPTTTTPTKPKPTDGPASKADAAPTAKRTAGPLDTLVDAKVGEWVRYRIALPNQTEPSVLKVAVSEVTDGTVVTTETQESGMAFPLPLPESWPNVPLLGGLIALGEVQKHETHTIEIKGKQVDAATVHIAMMGGEVQLLFTNDIPGWGLYRVQMGKVVLLEAIEWGVDAAAAASAAKSAPETSDEAKPVAKPAEPKTASPKTTGESAKPATAKADPVVPGPRNMNGTTTTPESDKTESGKPGPAKPASGEPSAKKAVGAKGKAKPPTVPNPMFDAKVGEWVRWRQVIQGQETEATSKVVEVTEDKVILATSIRYGKTELKGARLERKRSKHLSMGRRGRGRSVSVSNETVTINGTALACVVIERTRPNGMKDKRWYSSDIPVNGLVRHERAGTVVRELIAWGTSDDEKTASSK